MRLDEFIARKLNVEDGDHIKTVIVSGTLDSRIMVDYKNEYRTYCTHADISGNCSVDQIEVHRQGEVKLYGGSTHYHPQVRHLRIFTGSKVTVRGLADIWNISIQKDAVLFCNREFLEDTKDVFLTFEKGAVITLTGTKENGESWSHPHTYTADPDEDEHTFIDHILNPQITVLPDPLARVQVKPVQ